MKITKVLLLTALVSIGFSCSNDDDEPKPQQSNLEGVSFSLAEESTVVEVPPAMLSADDEYAQIAAQWVTYANAMTNNFALFTPPQGATKTTTPITLSGGRTAEVQKDYLVYVWTHRGYGSVAYQISEESDKYVFECFYKSEGTTEWLKLIYAEEKKDRTEGMMKVYSESDGYWINYNWKHEGDSVTFTVTDSLDYFNFKLTVNKKNKAGSVKSYYDNKLEYEIIWDGSGNGSWTTYDEAGEIESQDDWTV